VWDEAASKMDEIRRLEVRLKKAEEAVASGDVSALEMLDEATQARRLAGGFAVEERIGEVLHGLGFHPDDWHRSCDTFSGGWQMRIALARLLLVWS
jgi:ATP-binding cassette subfamily F protein 3